MKKLWVENIDNPAKVYQEEAPDGNFGDLTADMIQWDLAKNIMDWSRRRDMISPLFYAEAGAQLQNFAGLNLEKKMIGCKYFLVPYAVRMQLIDETTDGLNWEFLLDQTKESRRNCVEAMRIFVGQYIRTSILTLAQTQQFYKDVADMIIWFQQANCYDFKNWIFGLTPYETDFNSKDYYSIDMQNGLKDIYNGNY